MRSTRCCMLHSPDNNSNGDLGDTLFVRSVRLETLGFSGHTCFFSGPRGLILVSGTEVSPRCKSQSGRTLVESRCGVTGRI